ncbi:MAG: 3-oxoacyl-ACP reductase [Chloroflexi bacterium]|jgi:3-oxoacyl-[acyl-carrier protein] reductase|nr:3-oxoacyl-ACP reductase [Chloroflexota bacterium]MBI68163.1 3-oxoacyl-ACP reductase [Chloroflexota bacterium]HCH36245.1 3-oxoacyl-ACP reductase [Dehalococcoidia bacterium]|tara:strand:+ start:4721 stop:5554 length:834 start_codon:yes stop_codon:yes gene_type:complete
MEKKMLDGIKGKVAIVTGAGRGIGQGVALRLAQEGAKLVINDRDQEPLDETIKRIQKDGGEVVGIAESVTADDIGEKLAQKALDTFGDIHIVVPAAGFLWDGMIHRMTNEQFETIINVHLGGTFKVVRDSFKIMREKAREEKENGTTVPARRIVTISSLSGFGNLGQANYSAAKAGIAGLTRTVAIEGAMFNVLANSLAFGLIDTRMTRPIESQNEYVDGAVQGIPETARQKALEEIPLHRAGSIEEAVGPIVFFCSDLSTYTTGALLEVNGGVHIT